MRSFRGHAITDPAAGLFAFNLRITEITSMENSFSFSPLWREISIAKKVDPALKPLHGIILQRALRDIPLPELESKKLQTEGMYYTVLLALTLTLSRHS
jgi:hypothetical protein